MYNDKHIMEFIKYAIDENYNFDYSIIKSISWEKLFKEAKEHSLVSLIYYSISKLGLKKNISKELLNQWVKYTFLCSTKELNNMENIEELFKVLNENKLKFIALKGAVIKELYPKAEFRTMGDCDLIVKESDLKFGENILKQLGYKENEHKDEHGAHKVFMRNNQIIELHWTLINDDFFYGSKEFEKELWNNIRRVKIGKESAYALNHEYMIVHLIAHMAVHLVWSGFGIRQLLDLYLYSKKYEKNINWKKVFSILEESSLEKFSITLYIAIEKLFNYRINEENYDRTNNFNNIINNNVVKIFIEYIFNSGVFGTIAKIDEFTNTIINSKKNSKKDEIITYKSLLFPNVKNMNDKYDYAKRYKILIPIAWIHHLINGILHSEFSIKEKADFLFNSAGKVKSKEEMLKNIGLI